MRAKEPMLTWHGLDDATPSDAALAAAMFAHPALINRPIVVTHARVKLCRPSETEAGVLVGVPSLPALLVGLIAFNRLCKI